MSSVPAWIFLPPTSKHALMKEEDVALATAVYNKYKKCKKGQGIKAAIDALFYVNSYKVKSPSTYLADMTRIKQQFEKVHACIHAAFRPCTQLSAPKP